MQDLISVVVPIYKVEKYLSKCLNSIINQTFQNLEIILIDDGSPDGCSEICDGYAKKDERIKVIHQENGGLSVARNRGLDIAKGTFVCFVDPDDYLHPQMYESLYNNLKKYDADLSICGYETVFENDKYIESIKIPEVITMYNGREALGNFYGDLGIVTTLAWNKLYKKDLFENIRYGEKQIHEDQFIAHLILDKAKKVVYTNLSYYYYLQRGSSIMGEKFNLKRLDVLIALEERTLYFFEKGYDDLYEKAYNHYLENLLYHYKLVRKNCPNEKEISEKMRKKFLVVYDSRGDLLTLTKMTKIKYDIFSFSPLLYKIVNTFWTLSLKRIFFGTENSLERFNSFKKWRPERRY